ARSLYLCRGLRQAGGAPTAGGTGRTLLGEPTPSGSRVVPLVSCTTRTVTRAVQIWRARIDKAGSGSRIQAHGSTHEHQVTAALGGDRCQQSDPGRLGAPEWRTVASAQSSIAAGGAGGTAHCPGARTDHPGSQWWL